MPAFFCKLVAPRATFAQDMSAVEAAVMGEHVAYWKHLIDQGTRVFALGPVLDPAGAFGVAIVEAANEPAIRAMLEMDPAIAADMGMRYEVHSMPRGVLHG
ncbi:MAG: hypothetical protein KGJ94_02995 [Xanthomonadaceae bacterium]|nr:hypothetical protein [Xanthomonadaceae bacterium]